jgi:type IV pilus assembly protein PilW
VALVIGLLVTLVIVQVVTAFEGQKRSTTGSSDAQTNGSIALLTIQRDVQMAGFGLPVFDTVNPPLTCNPSPTVDHDGIGATPPIDMFPLSITDGGAAPGASDSITIRYGSAPMGGVPVNIITDATGNAVNGNVVSVDNNLGCQVPDPSGKPVIAIISDGGANCAMSQVTAVTDLPPTPPTHPDPWHYITLANPNKAAEFSSIACLGPWDEFIYSVSLTNQLYQLQRNSSRGDPITSLVVPTPIVADIVNIQAQYGISAAPNSNQVTRWVNATGAWAAPLGNTSAVCDAATANRNCIKAVRIAVVARNGLLEKTNLPPVTTACSSTTAAAPTGLCAWVGSAAFPAPTIDLSNIPNWNYYRYRVYETIIPLRNMLWSKNTL